MIRNMYHTMGVDNYYLTHSNEYSNPHHKDVVACLDQVWKSEWRTVLDLACGDGLVTKWIMNNRHYESIEGCDKFMADRYKDETGKLCFTQSFEEIALDKTNLGAYDVTVISYAIDLINESYLSQLIWNLSQVSKYLLIIRPNNHILEHWSLALTDSFKAGKSRAKVYRTIA